MTNTTKQMRFLDVYRAMVSARSFDELADSLGRRGEARFHLSGAGHEGMATLVPHLIAADWVHPHYRSKGMILARGIPLSAFCHALLATDASATQGRRMPLFVSDPALHMLSIPTLVGNNANQAAGIAAAIRDQAEHPIVVCANGDGGTQQGEFVEAVAEAARSRLPVLFLVEHNHYALSTPTAGRTFYDLNGETPSAFYGVPIVRVDATDPVASDEAFGAVVKAMRKDRGPRIVVARCERLASHSNSDDESVYRSDEERSRIRASGDPIPKLRAHLLDQGLHKEVVSIEQQVARDLQAALAEARAAGEPRPCGAVSRPLPPERTSASSECRLEADGAAGLTMIEALRETFRARLADDPRVTLLGEDIEDPKGDVFGITRGLSTEFGGRVVNSALSESTILGVSIGRALAGGRPVAFLQFADFFPVGFNQIYSEMASMYWRTAGQYEAPVIVMAVTGGYRPGLGPYHAQTPETFMLHSPGLDVFMPSTPADAAGLLNSAFESGRPSIFFYPKNLLNERTSPADPDVRRQRVPIGRARLVRAGKDLTLVGWGNTVALCEQAAEALASDGVGVEVLDLRTLSPWDRDAVVQSAERTGRLVVVHEDTRTCGLGAEILAVVSETASVPVVLRRVATPDTWLPFNYNNQLAALPSFRTILETAAGLLDRDVQWKKVEADEPGWYTLRATGSSPSDEVVRILAWQVAEGDTVEAGGALAAAEADKAAFDVASPVSGTVDRLLISEGEAVQIGEPIARIRLSEGAGAVVSATSADETPVLIRRGRTSTPETAPAIVGRAPDSDSPVMLASTAAVLGSRIMENEDLLDGIPGWNAADVVQRTGIERRAWIGEGESVLTLAVRAAQECLERENLPISGLNALICSTGTPLSMTPSLACRVLKELSPARGEVMVQAWDVNAACSGYLYALQSAHDFLMSQPEARILVVTAETLSPVLDRTDPGTLFLFGDAATATLVTRETARSTNIARLHRPVLSAKGEDESILYVPFPGRDAHLQMSGQQVFRVAVRKMINMLEQACSQAGLNVQDLAMIVPHQANTRIIEAIREKIKMPPERMFNHIREFANTSSNTIPLALREVMKTQKTGNRVGMCAFGGGFTFGAGILDVM